MKNARRALWAVAIPLLCLALLGARATLVNLATDVKNVLGPANGGTGAAITPPSSNGDYFCGYHVTGGVAVPMSCTLSGLVARPVTISTDTIIFSDNDEPVEYQGSSAVATGLPTPTTLGNVHFWTLLNNLTTGSGTLVTVTPAGGRTINGSATLAIVQNQECSIAINPSVSTDWLAVCSGNGVGGAVATVFGRVGNVAATSGDYTCAQVTGCGTALPVNPITSSVRSAAWDWSVATSLPLLESPPTTDYYVEYGGPPGQTGCATSSVPPCVTDGNGQGFLSADNWLVGQNIDFQESGQLTTTVAANTCVVISVNADSDLEKGCTSLGAEQNAAAFMFGGTIETADWGCMTASASANQITTSSIAADTNAHVFEIQFNDAVPNVVFKIDGTVACTVTTDLPPSGTVMQHGFYVGGTSVGLYREFAYYIQSGNSW